MGFGYFITIGIIVGIYIILTLSLNIISGYAGQASLGHAAFFGIGAYASALLTLKLGLNFWAALPLAMLAAGIIGAGVGIISLRIKGDFLAVTTIGINFVIVSVFEYSDFFGGAYGISGIQYPELFGLKISKVYYLILVFVFVFLTALFCRLISKSWLGLALETIRENEDAAEASGINCKKFKILAFAIGCALAGLAGVLYAHFIRFHHPHRFRLSDFHHHRFHDGGGRNRHDPGRNPGGLVHGGPPRDPPAAGQLPPAVLRGIDRPHRPVPAPGALRRKPLSVPKDLRTESAAGPRG